MPATRTIRGVRVVRPERAALDASRSADGLVAKRAVLCEVVQRGLATAERLAAELRRIDRRGLAGARRAVVDIVAGCRSAPECELRDLLRTSHVLAEPVWNQPLPDAPDIVPDGHIAELRLVLEVDSIEHHQFGDAPERTERRRARLASLGWRVYPVSPRRLREEPSLVLAEIEAAARVNSVSRGTLDAARAGQRVNSLLR
jgi:G:T-mismatch repair DNA endonuclease (very short patch repair protein)